MVRGASHKDTDMTLDMESAKLLAGRAVLAAPLIGSAWGYAWVMHLALSQTAQLRGQG